TCVTGVPVTSAISCLVRARFTNLTPSRDRLGQATADAGPPLTVTASGGLVYAASIADPPASARRSRYSTAATRPAAVPPSAAAWPTIPATGAAPGATRRIAAARPRATAPSAQATPCSPALAAAPSSSDLAVGGSGIRAGAV